MSNHPTGTVTFLFTDIQGSTALWATMPEAMRHSLAHHDTLVRQAIEAYGGHLFKVIGDAIQAAFSTSEQALRAAVAAQTALHRQPTEVWGETGPLRVRMGIHVGPAEWQGHDYAVAHTLNRVARIMAAGHGGQTLLSAAVVEMVRNTSFDFSLRDLGQHQLKGLYQTEHLYQLVAPDLPADFPPLNTLNARPNNLPLEPTSLVGRAQEVAAVRGLLLRSDVRLVTLVGPGGTGKTRLSLQVAAELLDHFEHGAYFVALAPVTDATLVPSTIAQTLEISEQTSKPLLQILKDYFRDKQLLLVLDNFEQVTAAAPVLAELLAAAPKLRILVSSRAALRVYGEKEFLVPPLSLPDLGQLPSLEQLTQYEAVQLFIERAKDVKPDFVVTNENAPAVAEICHRLDGLPLAIELAATRIRLLPPNTLLTRLASRLKLLTSGARNLPARQQTLRGAIDWSYNLLDESEQRLFRRLGVFVGGCTLEAAEAVCNATGDLAVDVLDGIESLVEKSLLRQIETASGDPRFIMLQTIWEYAAEQLAESDEVAIIEQHHTHFFLTLAEMADPQLRGQHQLEWLERLETEHDNLRAALRRTRESGDAERALRLASALAWFWRLRGYLSEGSAWLEGALTVARGPEYEARLGGVLSGLGTLTMLQGRVPAARRYVEQSKELFQMTKDAHGLAFALRTLGLIHLFQGDPPAAIAVLEESLALYRAVGDTWGVGMSLMILGMAALRQRDYVAARARFEESLTRFRQAGDTWFIAVLLNNLGDLARIEGDNVRATTLYGESLALFRKAGSKREIAASLHNLAYVAHNQGDDTRAAQLFAESLTRQQELGNREGVTECLAGFAMLAAAHGKLGAAARLFGAVATIRKAIGALAWPGGTTEYERNEALVRTQLDPPTFAAAWAEGQMMTLDAAVAYALGD
jgi:predicted ATPase/class 3 adenylate cyclase/Tfp pilus assembly protein PilF